MTPDILFLLSILPVFDRVAPYHSQADLVQTQGRAHLERVIEFCQDCFNRKDAAALSDPTLLHYIQQFKGAAHVYFSQEFRL